MANTEKLKVIQLLREARNAVDAARFKADDRQRPILEEALGELDRIEEELIFEELDTHLNALRADSQKLTKLSTRMQKSVQGLKKVAELIEKAAKGVKILVDAGSKLAGL